MSIERRSSFSGVSTFSGELKGNLRNVYKLYDNHEDPSLRLGFQSTDSSKSVVCVYKELNKELKPSGYTIDNSVYFKDVYWQVQYSVLNYINFSLFNLLLLPSIEQQKWLTASQKGSNPSLILLQAHHLSTLSMLMYPLNFYRLVLLKHLPIVQALQRRLPFTMLLSHIYQESIRNGPVIMFP